MGKLLILSCFVSVGFGQLVTHWNGAVTPYDPANAAATAAHLAIKSHPYAFYGKREAEAEPEAEPQYLTYAGHHLGYSHLGYGYAGYPYTTITTNVTTPLTVTMAAQKILTEIIEPTTMVLTTTQLTTQTVTDYKPALPNQNSQLTSYLNRIKLLKTILN